MRDDTKNRCVADYITLQARRTLLQMGSEEERCVTTLKTGKYRKLQLRGKGFGWAYKLGGLYPDGLISGRKKNVSK